MTPYHFRLLTALALEIAAATWLPKTVWATSGDFDGDGAITLSDYASFRACMFGPSGPISLPSCAQGDSNGDHHVDLVDFAVFQRRFRVVDGSGLPRIDRLLPMPGACIAESAGLAEIHVGFTKDVTVPSNAVTAWTVGHGLTTYFSTTFDDATETLRILFDPAIRDDQLTIVLDYTIVDSAGIPLDGEVFNPSNIKLPTGNGVQGGQAVFRFNILQGDTDCNGVVDEIDLGIVRASLGRCRGDAGFDARADLNGDGCVNVLDVHAASTANGRTLPPTDGVPPRIGSRAPSDEETFAIAALDTVTVSFSEAIRSEQLTPGALFAVGPDGLLQAASAVAMSNGSTVAVFAFEPPLTTGYQYQFNLTNGVADDSGELLASAPSLQWFATLAPPPPPKEQDSAVILGYVFETGSDPKLALAGVEVTAVYYPAKGDGPPLRCGDVFCKAITDSEGSFRFRTPPILGSETFLLRIRKSGFAENLRQVPIMAGRCWRVDDAFLNPVNPPVLVEKDKGATLTEPTGKITLVIPPNALMQNSTIGVTPLGSVDAIRDKPPPLVAPAGTFVDVAGVFGEATAPGTVVTMRVPNQYSLSIGTKVRFGKIDHNTLQWMDLCNAFDPGTPCDQNSNLGVGIVKSDGAGGTFIEVQFDHFCTVCTGYCLPYPTPAEGDQSGGSDSGDRNRGGCCGPGAVCGSSTVQQREGHLSETISLPSFQEMSRSWQLGLAYNSAAANPSVTLSASVNYDSTRPVEGTIFDFAIEGVKLEAAYDRSQNNQKPIGTFFWNGKNGLAALLPTGAYPYSIVATSLNANAPVAISSVFGGSSIQTFGAMYPGVTPLRSNELKGRAVLVNLQNSPYGAGWSILNEHRLEFDPDGCIVLVLGNADWRLFEPRPADPNAFDSPAGEFSTLRRQPDGTYVREFTDGARHYFTALGRIDRIVDRYGNVTLFGYENSLLTRAQSPTGYAYSLEYAGGKLSRIADSAGRESLFQVNAAGDLVAATDPTGATRTFEYDPDHLLIAQIGSRGERSEYVYENGRVVDTHSFDIDGTTMLRTRTFEPSALQGEISAALANGQGTLDNPIPVVSDRIDRYIDGRESTSLNVSDSNGQTIRSQDPLSRVTQYVYDANRLLTSRIAPNSADTKYEYDAVGYVTKITQVGDPATTNDDGITTFEYNGPFHQVSRLVDQEGKPTIFEYYPNGNLSCIEDALHNRTCFFYDDPRFPDIVTRIVDALNNTTTLAYDGHGQVLTITDPLSRVTTGEYADAAGNLTAVIDPRPSQPTTRMSYDAWNRVTEIVDAIGGVTKFDYEQATCSCSTANLTGVTMPNNSTITYDYDGLDRLVKMTDQLGHFSTYEYDAEGNRTTWTNRNGEVVTYAYDTAGQLVRKDVPGTGVTTYRNDSLGNLLGAANPASSLGFLYDLRGRMIQATQSFAPTPDEPIPFTYSIDYQNDRAGNRSRMQTPDVTIQYVNDALHRLTTLTETSPADPQAYTWTFAYDALSRLTRLDVPNGTDTEYAYDAAGQVSSILHKNPQGQTFSGVLYTAYDEAGNSTAQTWIQSAGSFDLVYSYDKLSRLISSTPPPAPDASFIDCAYEYDDANRLLSDCEYTYQFDVEGRQIEKRSLDSPLATKFVYDAEGRLLEVRQEYGDPNPQIVMTARYAYNALGRRVEKHVNGVLTRFVYDREAIIAELRGNSTPVQGYTHGPGIDRPLAFTDAGSLDRFYYHPDRLGSTLALTNHAGALTEELAYDAFGSEIIRSGTHSAHPYVFAAREKDIEAGLLYHRWRYYDPLYGRFLSEDTMGFTPGHTNLYSYVRSNPVNRTDPLGLFERGTKDWNFYYTACNQKFTQERERLKMEGKLCPVPIPGKTEPESIDEFCTAFADVLTSDDLGWFRIPKEERARKKLKQTHPEWPWQEWDRYEKENKQSGR